MGPHGGWKPELETQQDSFWPALGSVSLWEMVLSSLFQPHPAAIRSQAPIHSVSATWREMAEFHFQEAEKGL